MLSRVEVSGRGGIVDGHGHENYVFARKRRKMHEKSFNGRYDGLGEKKNRKTRVS